MEKAKERKREAKGKEENERYTHLNAEFQRMARRDKKAFLYLRFLIFAVWYLLSILYL